MIRLARPLRWLFTPPNPPGIGRSVLWWEQRRIPANLVIGIYGVVCLLIGFVAMNRSGMLRPGEDLVEPLGIMFAMILFNVCYTFGWIVEAMARAAAPCLTPKLGPRLLLVGLLLSACAISLPTCFWIGYAFLHASGIVK